MKLLELTNRSFLTRRGHFSMIAISLVFTLAIVAGWRGAIHSKAAAHFIGDETSIASPGDFDTTFNGTGKQIVSISPHLGTTPPHDVAYAVALQSDGKIVAAGYSADGFTTGNPPP